MRWNEKEPIIKKKTQIGDRRIKRWFAIFPVKINKETRWLEKVKVQQTFCMDTYRNDYDEQKSCTEWVNTKFLD